MRAGKRSPGPVGRLVLPVPGTPPAVMPQSEWRALVETPGGDVAIDGLLATIRHAAMASTADKKLLQVLRSDDVGGLVDSAAGDDRTAQVAQLMLGLRLLSSDPGRAVASLSDVLQSESDPAENAFLRRHLPDLRVWARLVPSVRVVMPATRQAVALVLADAYIDMGRPVDAVTLLELEPESPLTHLALGSGYLARRRFEAVIELTDNIANADDCTALLLVTRSVALRSLGQFEEAEAAANAALAGSDRSPGVVAIALEERSQVFHAQGNEEAAEADAKRLIVLEGFSLATVKPDASSPAETRDGLLEAARARVRPQLRGTGAPGEFAGRHHSTYRDEVRSMVSAGLVESAEDLLLGLLDVSADESSNTGVASDIDYFRALANLYASGDRPFEEYAILERHARQKAAESQADPRLEARRRELHQELAIAEPFTASEDTGGVEADHPADSASEFAAPPGYKGPFVAAR